MGETAMSEVLCIEGIHKLYAVEFCYVEEICPYADVSQMPCLPKNFSGMVSYKGNIIPVIRLEEEDDLGKKMIMILKSGSFMTGVVIPQKTFIVSQDQLKKVKSIENVSESDIWVEKEIYLIEGRLFSLLDIEETFKKLVLYP